MRHGAGSSITVRSGEGVNKWHLSGRAGVNVHLHEQKGNAANPENAVREPEKRG